MKTKLIAIIIVYISISLNVNAQKEQKEKDLKVQTIEIQTSAQCEMCKETLEEGIAFVKGVKSVNLNMETKKLTVKYKTSKTNPDKIRKEISDLGYDADDISANTKVYEKLPACCKKE